MARLIVNPRTPQAYEIQLKPGENYIGRGFANDFKLEDPSVSGSHCQFLVSGASVVIKDLGSTNGTFVNRSPIKEASLQPGQIIRMGAIEMVFESDNKSSTRPMPVATAIPVAVALPVATAVPMAVPVPAAARAAGPALPAAAILMVAPVATAAGPAPVIAARAAPEPASPPPPNGLRLSGGTTAILAAAPVPVASGAPAAALAQSPAPAPLRPAPPPEPVPTAVAPEGKTACKFHSNTAGRFLCPQCNNLFCSLCVASKKVTSGTSYFCRQCGVECAGVKVNFVPPKSKEKEIKEFSDVTILLRCLGFAFGAAMIAVIIWDAIVYLTHVEVPSLFAVATGALCGYAVKIAAQDRPGVIFCLIAIFFTLLGIVLAKVIAFFVLGMFYLGGLIYMTVGMVAAVFLAWKFGGGDF